LVAVPDHDRSRLSYKLGYAFRHPGRVFPYARRRSRDALLSMKSADHISYYRGVMASDAARCPGAAVGSGTHESWLKLGQLQFDYLTETLVALADSYGLDAQLMADWQQLGHPQSKIRVTRRS
jgi:hypothetical protein